MPGLPSAINRPLSASFLHPPPRRPHCPCVTAASARQPLPPPASSPSSSRRSLGLASAGLLAASSLLGSQAAEAAATAEASTAETVSPWAEADRAWAESEEGEGGGQVDTTVTDVVFLDVGMCPEGLRQDRALGDASALCSTKTPLGRVIIGLFGRQAPVTVANFLALVKSESLSNTTFNKILPGEYIGAGRQGPVRMGLLKAPPSLAPNTDTLNPNAFRLEHRRAGTVSLNLSENLDPPILRARPNYRNSQFLITTGPGPAPALDNKNIVFGRVLEGLDAVSAIASVPTFRPSERVQAWNQLAKFIGDDRAERVREKYGQPLKAVVITGTGILPIKEPFQVVA